jgi:3-hydroxyisobutyrate dehydrogenase-like beta-hydroxyacid dehydrogenase
MQEKIGFIGLGNMGLPMARNLIKAGFELTVYDIVKEPVEILAQEGVKPAANVAEAARTADFLITMLPKDAHIIQVYASPGGVLENIKDGAICIEMTSALGQTVIDMQNRALELGRAAEFLDAPVSGGVAGAENAALTIMCGGKKEVYDRCLPVLEAMGKKIFHTGGVGSGKSIKMIVQLLNAGNTLVAAESLFLARHLGLDMDILCGVVRESSGNSWIFENNIMKNMLPRQYSGGFRLELMKKDVGLSADRIIQDNLSMPLSMLVHQIYQAMENQGRGNEHYNVVGEWIEQQNPKNG